jgi:hypothetical protein
VPSIPHSAQARHVSSEQVPYLSQKVKEIAYAIRDIDRSMLTDKQSDGLSPCSDRIAQVLAGACSATMFMAAAMTP